MAKPDIPEMREALAAGALRLSIELHETQAKLRDFAEQQSEDCDETQRMCEDDDCCLHTLGEPIRDGGCLVCDECDGDEGHDGPHDCGHDR